MYSRRHDSTRKRNHTTQTKPRIHRNHKLVIDNIIYAPDCPLRLISAQQLHRQSKAKGHENSCFTIEENTATIFHGGDTFICNYHPKTKIPTISYVTHKTNKTTHPSSGTHFAQQPSHKGRKRDIVNETNNTTEPTAYITNLNTAQQELLRLHETYAHVDMKEMQQHIKTVTLKQTDKW
jgi:hypothetical protein